mmetsp:Transcript_34205/g.89960  ORF Transcript_34205/g.89960 Transcript_34205/m.89960 type:complete len:515 (+) Transcript_34205:114-1658(+)
MLACLNFEGPLMDTDLQGHDLEQIFHGTANECCYRCTNLSCNGFSELSGTCYLKWGQLTRAAQTGVFSFVPNVLSPSLPPDEPLKPPPFQPPSSPPVSPPPANPSPCSPSPPSNPLPDMPDGRESGQDSFAVSVLDIVLLSVIVALCVGCTLYLIRRYPWRRRNELLQQYDNSKKEVEMSLRIRTASESAARKLGRTKSEFKRIEKTFDEEVQRDQQGRFTGDLHSELRFGKMLETAHGIENFVCVSPNEMRDLLNEGLTALRSEFEATQKVDDILCMKYVLDQEAGSCETKWPNGNLKFDCGPDGKLAQARTINGHGKSLKDFVNDENARTALLEEAEVAALRIYTTSAYKSINDPLRNYDRYKRKERHPLALTVTLITNGVKKLRAVGAKSQTYKAEIELYRGMKDVKLPADFLTQGGTELALMSTTSDIQTALRYSASSKGVLLRMRTQSALQRGADLTFLSCFPKESECLWPPLTYLSPPGDQKEPHEMEITIGKKTQATFLVLEVSPLF